MFYRRSKDEAREDLADLVSRFEQVKDYVVAPTSKFTETETRVHYIDEFLKILGWDVANRDGKPEQIADVLQERTQNTSENGWGRPDYILRSGGENKLPVEAKKASVQLTGKVANATQARSYGWTLSVPGAVLTNFTETRIFDTRQEQEEGADENFSLIPNCSWTYDQYISDFDRLWDYLSFESVNSKKFEELYGQVEIHRGQSSFDISFLSVFRGWRLRLAKDIYENNPEVTLPILSQQVQKILNALLFMRICEDRNILNYNDLLMSAEKSKIEQFFKKKDKIFNAGIFKALDEISFSSDAILSIVKEMYWPYTKFAYSLINSDMLARIYEQYLAEQIEVGEGMELQLVLKPEIAHAGGIARTPEPIVRKIVSDALSGAKSKDIGKPKILDFAVGSGIFLLEALRQLVQIEVDKGKQNSLELRKDITQKQLFGLDIDGAAIEVARLSLLLEILGSEIIDTSISCKILPDISGNLVLCNTVVREDFDDFFPEFGSDIDLRTKILPSDVFRELDLPKGNYFDVVIGNPPHVRIQILNEFHHEQLSYLKHKESGYVSPQSGNFDLWMVFLERALELVSDTGQIVTVVPNRFFGNDAAGQLRNKLLPRLEKIIDFGVNQVFDGKTTYVCIIHLGEEGNNNVGFQKVESYEEWVINPKSVIQLDYPKKILKDSRWTFLNSVDLDIFNRMRSASERLLGDVAEVFVGVQTSKDDIYFIHDVKTVNSNISEFSAYDGSRWEIETELLRKAIKDTHIDTYDGQPISDCAAIFPYELIQGPKSVKAKPIPLDTMVQKYPKAFAYFEHYKAILTSRKISPNPGEAYWAYGRSQSLVKLSGPKIIVRVLSNKPSYALDTEGMVIPGGGDGGPYYLIRSRDDKLFDNDVLQAVLCHPVVDRFVTENGKKYRGSYAVHKKSDLVGIPLPPLGIEDAEFIRKAMPEIRLRTTQLSAHNDDRRAHAIRSRRNALIERIEAIISKSYGIMGIHEAD